MERQSRTARLVRTILATAATAVATLTLTAPGADAALLARSATGCPAERLEQPFLRWADPFSYVLAPGGTIESDAAWALDESAPVEGNEPWFVHAEGERRSLALPPGSTATTGSMCVGLGHPTLRLFARNGGSPLSPLLVEVLFEDGLGLRHALPIGTLAAGDRWGPTLPLPVVANLLPLLPGERTPVRFRFTPVGDGGGWQLDDVYVDPYRK